MSAVLHNVPSAKEAPVDRETLKELLECFLQRKLKDQHNYSISSSNTTAEHDSSFETDGIGNADQFFYLRPEAESDCIELDGVMHTATAQMLMPTQDDDLDSPSSKFKATAAMPIPPKDKCTEMAACLIKLAKEFERDHLRAKYERGGGLLDIEGNRTESEVINQIRLIDRSLPVDIQQLASILKNNLSLRTVEESLEYITTSVNGWPGVALSFDLVAAVYVTRAAVDNLSWLKDMAADYLSRRNATLDLSAIQQD